jgi:hypothetical protein
MCVFVCERERDLIFIAALICNCLNAYGNHIIAHTNIVNNIWFEMLFKGRRTVYVILLTKCKVIS